MLNNPVTVNKYEIEENIMDTKVSDLTVDELKKIIREVIEDYIDPDGELREDFAQELRERIESKNIITHEDVWSEK